MIKPEQVPIEVYNAFQRAWLSGKGGQAAIAAAINAWPWAKQEHRPDITFDGKPVTGRYLVLPLSADDH